jgi:hypothetical protein
MGDTIDARVGRGLGQGIEAAKVVERFGMVG